MKHILILGATSDIAQALAHKFAGQGCTITLAARNPERLAAVVTDMEIRHSVAVDVAAFDALNYGSHADFYQHLATRPDVVIAVFGLLGDQQLGQMDFAEAERIIDSNFTGAVSILNIVANDFEKRRAGTIIGFSSVAGERGRQSNYLYGSAKAGFTAYLSGLRNRLARANVHVITVKPGFVRTKMTAKMPLPAPVTARPVQVANDVYQAYQKQSNVVYSLWMWRFIMLLIRNIPEGIFKRLSL